MKLTNRQKRIIEKHKRERAKDISRKYNIPQSDVEEYMSGLNIPPPRFSFYIILLLIPVLFFVLLEAGLRIFNYGHDITQWVELPGEKLMLNSDVAYRYFYNTKGIPYSAGNAFDKIKKNNSIRIFVIGESSAAGYPFSPNGSFAKYIRKRLELIYPERNIEVINISMAAINSYTLRDLFPGVLEQKPDMILCYTGHNEFYGALGAGSTESLGSYRSIVNAVLYLNRFKTIVLLRDGIKSLMELFSGSSSKGGTLMSRMAGDQYITYNSDVYKNGIEQFRGNMRDIIDMSDEAGVPFIIGTLISNLKDQEPFVSIEADDLPAAADIYEAAMEELNKNNYKSADSLFRYAKDLDVLRFRAPEEINEIIRSFGKERSVIVADIDSAYRLEKIPGNEIMTDHLHPSLSGYQDIGRLFFDKIRNSGFIKASSGLSETEQDSLVKADYDFTQLDSTIARYRLITLKSDWPYVKEPLPVREVLAQINARDYVDSLALFVVDSKLDWEMSHRQLAAYYLSKNDVKGFIREMDVLIDQYSFINEYYTAVTRKLIERKEFDSALPYLYKSDPDAFSSKWIGIIQLSGNNVEEAAAYLEKSRAYYSRDPQVLYNLAGAYALKKDYTTALRYINECLMLDSNYPGAADLNNQLQVIVNQSTENN